MAETDDRPVEEQLASLRAEIRNLEASLSEVRTSQSQVVEIFAGAGHHLALLPPLRPVHVEPVGLDE